MRYALMRKMDISNGIGIGVSLFVQGCHFHCKGCFNQETWDFNSGKEWNQETKKRFFKLIDKPYIMRVSFLGGEPLADENIHDVCSLAKEIKAKFPNKDIWLYTGYVWEQIKNLEIVKYIDVVVDGPYIEDQRDLSLAFCGSKNQRLIDVKETIKQNKIVTLQI